MKRKYLASFLSISLVLSMLWLLVGCNRDRKYPEEGVWYCEEYQIQISFEPPEYECYVTVDGKQVECTGACERGSTRLILICRERDNPRVNYEEIAFAGNLISRDDDKFVMRGDDGTKYVFVRRD